LKTVAQQKEYQGQQNEYSHIESVPKILHLSIYKPKDRHSMNTALSGSASNDQTTHVQHNRQLGGQSA